MDEAFQEEERPPTEEEAEAEFQRRELLARRINARLEAAGPHKDYERIVGEEIDRLRREHGDEPDADDVDLRADWTRRVREAVERPEEDAPDFLAGLNFGHPLVVGVNEFAIGVRRTIRASGLRPEGASPEHPLYELESALFFAGLRLAATLSCPAWPPPARHCAAAIAMLKRVNALFDDAELAVQCCEEIKDAGRRLSLDELADDIRSMRAATEQLIADLRERLRDQ